jgi:hypothetical protein
MCAARPGSPDHPSYLQVKQRLGGKRAALSVASIARPRGLPHLRELGDQALVPADLPPPPEQVGILRTWAPESLLWCASSLMLLSPRGAS